MNVLLGLYEESILVILMYEVNVKACGLMIGLHMYIALVDLDWNCE